MSLKNKLKKLSVGGLISISLLFTSCNNSSPYNGFHRRNVGEINLEKLDRTVEFVDTLYDLKTSEYIPEYIFVEIPSKSNRYHSHSAGYIFVVPGCENTIGPLRKGIKFVSIEKDLQEAINKSNEEFEYLPEPFGPKEIRNKGLEKAITKAILKQEFNAEVKD